MSKAGTDEWFKSGGYLPAPLRDFHDQKDVFKAMHATVRERPDNILRRPSWIDGHVYVIDVFLWFMAKHGWTLQRTRGDGEFLPLSETIKGWRQREADALVSTLSAMRAAPVTP